MDERGLTIDPNRDPLDPTGWWEEIGATQKPSPYRTASWAYVQEHHKEPAIIPTPGTDPPVGIETNRIFATVYVYDSKASSPDPRLTGETLDTRGVILGHLTYEIIGPVMTLTDWAHNKWQDATPVKQAFKALMANTPNCVQQVVVHRPEAFWKSLGFVHPNKDADVLILSNPNSQAVPF